MLEPLRRESRPTHFDRLYRELQPGLLRFAEGLLGDRASAEEAVQDAFAAAMRSGPLDEPKLWLYRVTRNAAVDQLRRQRRLLSFEVVDAPEARGQTPERSAELSEDLGLVRTAIDRLGEQQRAALLLRELNGCSYAEIARVLDVGEGNVKILIHRARHAIQDYVDAARLSCADVTVTLSAAHDGEADRVSAARAKLHAAGCRHCRRFGAALREQRGAIALLVPLQPAEHLLHAATVHALHGGAAAGGKGAAGKTAIGGLLGLKSTAATTAAVVTIGAGGVALSPIGPVHPMHFFHKLPLVAPAKPAAGQGATVPAPPPSSDAAAAAVPWEMAGTPIRREASARMAGAVARVSVILPPAVLPSSVSTGTAPIVTDATLIDPTLPPTVIDATLVDPTSTGTTLIDPTLIDPTLVDPTLTDPTQSGPTAVPPVTDPAATGTPTTTATDPTATPPTTNPTMTDPSATDPNATGTTSPPTVPDPSTTPDPTATDPSATDPSTADPNATGTATDPSATQSDPSSDPNATTTDPNATQSTTP